MVTTFVKMIAILMNGSIRRKGRLLLGYIPETGPHALRLDWRRSRKSADDAREQQQFHQIMIRSKFSTSTQGTTLPNARAPHRPGDYRDKIFQRVRPEA